VLEAVEATTAIASIFSDAVTEIAPKYVVDEVVGPDPFVVW